MADRRRRANGEGSVYQATDGRWVARISLGINPETGKPLRKVAYGKTPAEAARKLRALHAQQERAELSLAPGRSPTVRTWLERWLRQREASPDLTERTNRRVRTICELHLIPALGSFQLSRLQAAHVKALTDRLQREGRSPGTAFNVRAVLRTALNDAAKERLIGRNVAADAKAPRRTPKEMKTLSEEQVKLLFAGATTVREGNLYVLLVTTGMRLSEALGLTWGCYDSKQGKLQVRMQLQRQKATGMYAHEDLKTPRSLRTLVLNQKARLALELERLRQAELQRKAGPRWRNRLDLVFTSETGAPMIGVAHHPYFRDFLKENGLPAIRIHDLRHTYASLALAKGVPVINVSRALGHSNGTTTINTYMHVIEGGMEALAATMDSIFTGETEEE